MTYKRCKFFLNFILIASIVFSGIYFGDVQTDFTFINSAQKKIQSIYSGNKDTAKKQLCTDELISMSRTLLIREEGSRSNTINQRHICTLSLWDILSCHTYLTFGSPYIGDIQDEVCSNTIIINYIHHQDGEKS